MNAIAETGILRDSDSGSIISIQNGIYHDLSNEDYHSGPAISKSQLDDIAISPAVYQWKKHAPIDEEKTQALDMGTALHCILLEPDEFEKRFIFAPEFNRKKPSEREKEQEFIKECKSTGKTVMTFEEGRKLHLMRESVMAHPDARLLLEQPRFNESSMYWTDSETGEQCRIRPDSRLENLPIIFDVKKVDDLSRFPTHAEEFRYYVQDGMYTEGAEILLNEPHEFYFLMVSSSIDCARYPVRVRPLEEEWKALGREHWHRDLRKYHECRINNDWHDFETVYRPFWAKRKSA